MSWAERTVHLDLSRDVVKKSPAWNGDQPVNREYEAHLYDYYGRPVYWANGDRPQGLPTQPHPGSHPR